MIIAGLAAIFLFFAVILGLAVLMGAKIQKETINKAAKTIWIMLIIFNIDNVINTTSTLPNNQDLIYFYY